MCISHKMGSHTLSVDGYANVTMKESSLPLAFSMSSSSVSPLPSLVNFQMPPQKGNQSFCSEAAQYGNTALPGGPMMALKPLWK